jgi:hypothetical protein
MNVPGPLSISSVNAPRVQELDLRPFQRVTATILSVTGTTALLSIEGYPVVAQLASSDQAATLLSQQTAQLIVTQRTSEKITLKVTGGDQPQASPARSAPARQELAVRLLDQQNIPVTANHLIVARAMLRQHLPVTPMLLDDLMQSLSAYGSWGSREAGLAAALKAAGLPLTAESLALASRHVAQTGDSLARLLAKLTDMAGQDFPPEVSKQLDSNLQILRRIVPRADGDPAELAKRLGHTVKMLGTSLERSVWERMQEPEIPSENSLLGLVQLQQSLEQVGKSELADHIQEFIKDLQRTQFLNAKPDSIPGQRQWIEMGFAVSRVQQETGETFSSARLRIATEPGSASGGINPAHTRIILQVDPKPGQTVEVDLSIVDKQIKSAVNAPDELWCRQAQKELPALEQAFQRLGFTLKDTQFEVGEPQPFERLMVPGGPPLMTVDLEA